MYRNYLVVYKVESKFDFKSTCGIIKHSFASKRDIIKAMLGVSGSKGVIVGVLLLKTFKLYIITNATHTHEGTFTLTCRATIKNLGNGRSEVKVSVSVPPIIPILVPALIVIAIICLLMGFLTWNGIPFLACLGILSFASILFIGDKWHKKDYENIELNLIKEWVNKLSQELGGAITVVD